MAPLLPVLLVLLAAPAAAPATLPSGRTVRCEGRAAPRLHEEASNVTVTRLRTGPAAREAAVRDCLARIRALPLAGGVVGDRLSRDPQLARELEALVRATRTEDAPRLFSDGGVELGLTVPLDGKLSRLLAGSDTWPAPGAGTPNGSR